MQKLAALCIRRPVFATMLIVALLVLGMASYRNLGVDLYPKIDFPTVTVTTTLRGASPEEIENQVTKRIEEAVNTVSGIDELRSVSAEGVSQVIVAFVLEKDADIAAQEVRDKVATVARDLPEGCRSAGDREALHRRIAGDQRGGGFEARPARDH